MISQTQLSDQQEELRREGLRVLARVIARHYIEHSEQYVRRVAPEESSSGAHGQPVETRVLDTTDREEAR